LSATFSKKGECKGSGVMPETPQKTIGDKNKGYSKRPMHNQPGRIPSTIKFIDLFAGIGGMRKGFEAACKNKGFTTECVFTSEIKQSAIQILKQNNPGDEVYGDITKINSNSIPDFHFLLAGFPCQAFSAAGKRLGFSDTRGTLFFDVERILRDKKPHGFILENVEGLVTHDKINNKDEIGRTLSTIINNLQALGYKISWQVLDAKNFGVPQERKRIYITGSKNESPDMCSFNEKNSQLKDVLEQGIKCTNSRFIDLLLTHYSIDDLYGKSIKDKRGGDNNIHSWDIGLKGEITTDQREILTRMMKERRKKKWAEEYGIEWMDGMPLTLNHIKSFYNCENIECLLEDLVVKKYLKKEYPKQKKGNKRIQDSSLPLGYNIVAGKKSFEVNKILDPKGIAPTLVAMDMEHLFVVDNTGLRRLSLREGLRLFGFPENFKFDIDDDAGYDLLGNTVVVPVIEAVSERVIDVFIKERFNEVNTTRSLRLTGRGRENTRTARAD